MSERIASDKLRAKVMTAEEAAQFVNHGDKVGISGFTGAGYPKAMPAAIAAKATDEHNAGREYAIDLFTGASTAPEATASWRKQMRCATECRTSLTRRCVTRSTPER